MDEQDYIERLKTTPVTETGFGNARTRRVIKNAGFDTLWELFALSEKEIDDCFEPDVADAIIDLRDQYRTNPEKSVSSVLQKEERDKEVVNAILAEAKASRAASPKSNAPTTPRSFFPGDCPTTLPSTPFAHALRDFEKRAKDVFDDLDDRFDDVMVYQAFEEFPTDLDELSDAFLQLFDYYSDQPRSALDLIDWHLRNAFAIFVADRARNVYSDANLWGNFFAGLPSSYGNVQSLFKHIFVDQIKQRRMPLYARDEEVNCYYYTALLHGGLSTDSWFNLWKECILPLAKEIADGHYGFGGEMDGRSILKELKNPESRFAPKKAVLNILEKAPDSTIAPLFEASMRVAAQVESSKTARSSYTMLSNFGLPEAAMDALRESQEKTFAATRPRSSSSPREKRQSGQRLIYLPMASLQLDLAEGIVSMHWPRQQFPLHFDGARIDYYVDGEMKQSSKFSVSVGKCILEAASIAVKPQARYDVQLKLMQKSEQTGEYVEVSSLNQTFTRSKPGCFEFIKDAKGLYRLRGRNERIAKKRRIAYIVKEGYRVEPGQGMTAVSEYEASGGWNETQIFVYDVDPGAAGAIVNNLTGEEVAVWQERYVAKIDKRRVIGETVDGVDLYGYARCGLGTNGGLPSISIESFDGLAALDDLDIICISDGQRVSVPRHPMWSDCYGDSAAARIVLAPQKSSQFDLHIEECLIEARQKSAEGRVVFRYRFAVVPIQDFRPTSISFDFGIAVAEYGFQARLALDVTGTQRETEAVGAWGKYTAKTLLKDEFLHLRIRSSESGKETDAKLALAAIDVEIPDALARVSKEHPVCLADVLELGPSAANFGIVSYGWRYNRAVIAWLGSEPLFFKELKQPGVHKFNLFEHAASFRQVDESKPDSRPLKLSLIYGDDVVTTGYPRRAWTEAVFFDCVQGVGISGWKLLATADGNHVLRFKGCPACDVCFEFKRKMGKRLIPIEEASADAGATELVLPSSVVKLLDAQKMVIMEMSPSDWLGKPQREYATKFTLKRQA